MATNAGAAATHSRSSSTGSLVLPAAALADPETLHDRTTLARHPAPAMPASSSPAALAHKTRGRTGIDWVQEVQTACRG